MRESITAILSFILKLTKGTQSSQPSPAIHREEGKRNGAD
ncbi:hypothetical protein J2747_001339 [Thermococcus stetteri]|nr:hypothetical protein [Thermococcus stetteri]